MKNLKDLILKNQFYLSVVVAICLIGTGLFFGWYNNRIMPTNTNPIARYQLEPHNPLSFMANWDSLNYINLANAGYTNVGQANFFPLYPLLIHILTLVTGSALDSALIISWLCLIGAIYFYMKVVGFLFKDKGTAAVRAVLLLLFFPTAIFFLAAYTESLFALLALAAIYYALRKRYLLAAAFALPMTATHVTGVFVLALIGLIMIENKAKLTHIIMTVGAGSLGLLSFMFYLYEKYRRPFAFITSQESHGWLSTHYTNLFGSTNIMSVAFIALILLAAVYWWNRRRSFAVYGLLFLLIPIVGQQFGGFNRYVLMAFSVPLMLYGFSRKRPNLYVAMVVVSAIAWTYTLLQYSGGYIGS